MATQFNTSLLPLFQITSKSTLAKGSEALLPQAAILPTSETTKASRAAEAGAASKEDPTLVQHAKDVEAFVFGSLDGSVSVVGDLARKMYGEKFVREIESTGAMFEGNFISGLSEGDTYAPTYGKFADRQNAMINAFHYAQEGLRAGKLLAAKLTSEVLYPTSPDDPYVMRMAKLDVDNALSILTTQFGFEGSIVSTNEDGTSSFTGFEVSHDRFGKLLSIDAGGTITLYAADGTAYSMADYDAARPDGVIPELANLVAGKSCRLSVRV